MESLIVQACTPEFHICNVMKQNCQIHSNPKPRLQVIETLLKVHTKNMQLAQIASCSKLAKDAHKNMQLEQIAHCSKLAKDAHKNMRLAQIASHSKLAIHVSHMQLAQIESHMQLAWIASNSKFDKNM
jgi:hypothetical protein